MAQCGLSRGHVGCTAGLGERSAPRLARTRRHQSRWHSSALSDVPTNTDFIRGRHGSRGPSEAEQRAPPRNPPPSSSLRRTKALDEHATTGQFVATPVTESWSRRTPANTRLKAALTEPPSGSRPPAGKTEMAPGRPYIRVPFGDVTTHAPILRRLGPSLRPRLLPASPAPPNPAVEGGDAARGAGRPPSRRRERREGRGREGRRAPAGAGAVEGRAISFRHVARSGEGTGGFTSGTVFRPTPAHFHPRSSQSSGADRRETLLLGKGAGVGSKRNTCVPDGIDRGSYWIQSFKTNCNALEKGTTMEKGGNIQLEIPDFSNSVLSHLNQLRMQGRLCDIVVNVQGQAFRAHKVVLAASSPYFRDHMSLNEMSTVSISVIKNPTVFEQLLSFCYTGRICLQLADIISYLTAASFLQMQHIIDKCTQILEGIHFKINVAEVEAELSQTRTKHQERPPESHRVTPNLNRSISPRHNTPKGNRRGQVSAVLDIRELSPPGESTSPQIIEQSSDVESREPILRINRAGQWYVETGVADRGGRSDDEVRVLGAVHIKTENLEEWLGPENQPSGEDGSSAEEVTAMVIDTTGHGSVGQETYSLGSSGAKVARPTSSEVDRFSPSGSVVPLTERHRARSESPGRMDEPKQLSSQVEESAMMGVSGYVEYLREQEVSERWFRYNPRLTCIYCAKSFNQKGSLDRHMRLHMGITPFVCRMCGKKYTRKDQLEYHIRKHTGNKPFHCHVCGKSFPFQAILNQHFRKNHPGCIPLEGPHSISPETTVTSRGQAEEASPSQEETVASGETAQGSVSTTGPD